MFYTNICYINITAIKNQEFLKKENVMICLDQHYIPHGDQETGKIGGFWRL